MVSATFHRFLTVAGKHPQLIIDLCNEPDFISHSKLLLYMERCGIPAAEKSSLVTDLCKVRILLEEVEHGYSVNPAVANLVNYYERRGRLTSAAFLHDQMVSIATLTDTLQRQLFSDEPSREIILDTMDNLYRLVREVRVTGNDHYIACMLLFADMKRSSEGKSIEQRLDELETAQRRHVEPLRALIDPGGEYVNRLETLKRRMDHLGANVELLASSQELDAQRQRINSDLQYIDHVLLRDFGTLAGMATTLLKSLMEERRVRDAIVACLSDLKTVWQLMDGQTVLVSGRNIPKLPSLDTVADFFADVVHHKLLPRPKPLTMLPVRQREADEVIIREDRIWACVREAGTIASWPPFVASHFRQYSESEQLKAITLPMLAIHRQVMVIRTDVIISCDIGTLRVQLRDFGLTWRPTDDTRHSAQKSGHLSTASARLSI
jgi:hypothetical protein